MRRLIALALVSLLSSSSATAAAPARGSVEGRVVNVSTGRPQPNASVTLTRLETGGGGAVTTSVRSDDRGRYSFTGLPVGDRHRYALEVRHDGGLFAGSLFTIPAGTRRRPVIDTTVRVWATTTDPAALVVTRDDMFVVLAEGSVAVIESVTVSNITELAYVGRGRALDPDRRGDPPSIGFALPAGARNGDIAIRDATLDVPELVPADFGFAATAAIPPGTNRITFSYEVPGSGGSFDLTRPVLYRTGELSVYAAEPLEVRSDRLERAGEVTLADERYRKWTTGSGLDPGDEVPMVAVAQVEDAGGLRAGLIAGAAVLVLALALAGRGRRRRAERAPRGPSRSRDDLLVAIAELDLQHEAGKLSDGEWRRRRERLKDDLAAGASALEGR